MTTYMTRVTSLLLLWQWGCTLAMDHELPIDLDTPLAQAQEEVDRYAGNNTGIRNFIKRGTGSLFSFLGGSIDEKKHAQWKNTVLLSHPKVPVAFYRKDFFELPFFIGDLSIAYWLFSTFKARRIKYLYTQIIDNLDQHISWINKIKETAKKLHNTSQDKLSFQEVADILKEQAALEKTMNDTHHYVGYNIFKKELIQPLFIALCGHQLSASMSHKLLHKRSWALPESLYAWKEKTATQEDGSSKIVYERFKLDEFYSPFTKESLSNEATSAVEEVQNYDKEISKNPVNIIVKNPAVIAYKTISKMCLKLFFSVTFCTNSPVSATHALQYIVGSNPNTSTLEALVPPIEEPLKATLDKIVPKDFVDRGFYTLIGLPSWFYSVKESAPIRYGLEIIMLAGTMAVINNLYHAQWMRYMKENGNEFEELLNACKSVQHLSDSDEDKKAVHAGLEAFIRRGNSIYGDTWSKSCQEFFTAKMLSHINVNAHKLSWLTIICTASLALKIAPALFKGGKAGYSLYKAGILTRPDFISPEAAPFIALGSFYGLYFGLIGAIVAFNNVTTVWNDIKLMKETVTAWFKGNKKKERSKTNSTTVITTADNPA